MKWLTVLWTNTLGRIFASDSGTRNPAQWLVDWIHGEESASGVKVTPKSALKLAPFWQGVNTIAGDVATLPLILHRRAGDRKERWVEHPAYRLLRRAPNPWMTATAFKETLQAHALTYGNAYAEIERDNRGDAIALWPLLPDRTEPLVVDGVVGYVTQTTSGEPRRLRAENVLHIKGLGFDGVRGYSVIAMARQNLGLTMAQEKYAARFFGSGATPGGVLEHPGKIGEDAIEQLRESWAELHEGLDRSHRIAILEEGMKFNPIAMPMRDAQWLEGRQFGRTDVASWLNLPPHKVGDLSRATFTNIEEQNRDYLNTSLMRWLVKWQEECDEKLLRAVAAASTPVVSAIGHENDHPLLDDVADLRASTPTDAAKRVVPDVAEQRSIVQQLRSRARSRLTQRVTHDIAQLDQLRSRPVLRAPEGMLVARSHELFALTSRGRDVVTRSVHEGERRVAQLQASLRALSPGATLARGYAIAHTEGGVIVRDATQAPAGTDVIVTVAEGSFAARSEGPVAEDAPAP